jgi:hypothetical protein
MTYRCQGKTPEPIVKSAAAKTTTQRIVTPLINHVIAEPSCF